MTRCELRTSCFFFNEQVANMPQIVGHLRDKYCNEDFASCIRFRISQSCGRDKVPTYIYPNGFYEARSHFEPLVP